MVKRLNGFIIKAKGRSPFLYLAVYFVMIFLVLLFSSALAEEIKGDGITTKVGH